MHSLHRSRQVGITAIACALLMRLFIPEVPENLIYRLKQSNTDTVSTEQKTGHNVRFSSSLDVFSPDFIESPPPILPEITVVPLPSFSGEEAVKLYYAANIQPDIAELLQKPLQWNLTGEEPSVLILHTHATESYSRQGENYTETSAWRTLDADYNMLALGKLVAEILKENNIPVIHDESLYDHPSYNGSYSRARKTLQQMLENHPGIRLVLDLHRDASGGEEGQMRTKAEVEGQTSAQLMVVIGTNHENYEENLSLGLKLHALLEQRSPGIMRPLQLRGQRFNQDLSPGALLIEVGAAGNTHPEAKLAAEELARAIIALAEGTLSDAASQQDD